MSIRIDGTNTTANPGITGADADTGLQFGTDEISFVTGGTNRATVESNGNFTIESGNLVLASGSGIDFSATADGSGTMTSELLDDYEEGTWTPTYVPQSNSFTSITYDAVVYGYYQKVGQSVYVHGFIRTNALTIGTASGVLYISGLPFSQHISSGENQGFYITNSSNFSGENPSTMQTATTAGNITLYHKTVADGDTSVQLVADMGTGVNANQIYFSGIFRAA